MTPPVVTPPAVTLKKPTLTLPKQKANMASVKIVCQSACTVSARLKATESLAKRLRLKSWTIGSARLKLKAGTTIVRVAIRKSILRKLRAKRIRSAKFTLLVTVTDASGLVTSVRKSPRISISKR